MPQGERPSHSADDLRDFAALVFVSCCWGTAFLFSKIAGRSFGSFTVVFSRMAVGALLILLYLALRHIAIPKSFREWLRFLPIGLFNCAIPYLFMTASVRHIDSSLAIVINAMSPLFTVAISTLYLRQRLSKWTFAGVITGFCGVVLLIAPSIGRGGSALWAQLMVVGMALSYAIATLLLPRTQAYPPPLTSFMQSFWAALICLPFSFIIERPWTMSPSLPSLLALAELIVFPTVLAAMIYIPVLLRVGPSRAIITYYLNPISGVLAGVLFLSERLSLRDWFCFAVIMTGVLLMNRAKKQATAVKAPEEEATQTGG